MGRKLYYKTRSAKRGGWRASARRTPRYLTAHVANRVAFPLMTGSNYANAELYSWPTGTDDQRGWQDRSTDDPTPQRLTRDERKRLRLIGMSDANIRKCAAIGNNVFYLDCRNSRLEGCRHPETDVPFMWDRINIGDVEIRGVFPVFESILEKQLPKRYLRRPETDQFNYLNNWLRRRINDPYIRRKFNKRQIEMIRQGKKPRGYTWHHNQQQGLMQLVRTDIHARTAHTGGDSIWCGR